MKKIFLSLCFAAFLGAGLTSCADEAAEITPNNPDPGNTQIIYTEDEPGVKKP